MAKTQLSSTAQNYGMICFPAVLYRFMKTIGKTFIWTKINSVHYFKKILKKHFIYKYTSADEDDFIYF